MRQKAELRPMRPTRLSCGALFARLGLLLVLLCAQHGALLYPFFLDGVAAEIKLNQADGLHPNPAGVDVIVARILPSVEELVMKAGAK